MPEINRFDRFVVIIGAMKSGTTTLHTYLNSHPSIGMSRIKEPEYFVEESRWHKGLDWYLSLMPPDALWTGEASTSYAKYPEFKGVPQRLASHAPNAKLIYIVRNPIKRTLSSYVHGVAKGWEQRTLDEALNDPEKSIHVMPSCYHLQLSQYLPYYDRSQIFVTSLERMSSDKDNLMREIFRFIGVDENAWDPNFEARENTAEGRTRPTAFTRALMRLPAGRQMRGAIRRFVEPDIEKPRLSDRSLGMLTDFLREDINKFKEFTGMPFDEWAPDFA